MRVEKKHLSVVVVVKHLFAVMRVLLLVVHLLKQVAQEEQLHPNPLKLKLLAQEHLVEVA
jgi:hypothetical protein